MGEWVIIAFYNASNVLVRTARFYCYKIYLEHKVFDIPEGATNVVVNYKTTVNLAVMMGWW